MDEREKIFVDGVRLSELSANTPTFIIAKMGFKVDEFTAFLKQHETNNGYVNVDIKLSKNGKMYAELNTYVPQQRPAFMEPKEKDDGADAIPF